MSVELIPFWRLALMLLLVLPILWINHHLNIKKTRTMFISIARMSAQLTLVGIYLQYIFYLDIFWLNIAYILLMILVATISVGQSMIIKARYCYGPVFLALLVPDILVLFFFNAFIIRLSYLFEAKYLITLGGMLLGNGLSGCIIGLSTFFERFLSYEPMYQFELEMGATRYEATKPFLKVALTTVISPTLASMATMGLVALPGMMTGQILGGSLPIDAIKYQIGIMIAIFVTKYMNVFFAVILTSQRVFDKKDQFIRDYLKK